MRALDGWYAPHFFWLYALAGDARAIAARVHFERLSFRETSNIRVDELVPCGSA
jgi:hypothetical protein